MALPTTLNIASLDRPPVSTPHLMPFHIAYTGPAPISTYFRVKPAPEPTYGRDVQASMQPSTSTETQETQETQETTDSQATLVASSSASGSLATLRSNSSTIVPDVEMAEEAGPSSSSRHFTASFRGRSMRGVEVDLPEGYAGVVLRAPDDKKGKGVSSGSRAGEDDERKSRGKATRKAKREREVIVVEDNEMDTSGDPAGVAAEEGPTRTLQLLSTFSSFVLWHPDIPVDEGRDEFLRPLSEWTRLAAEIHRIEDC